jgi:hypothetical protein
MGPSNINHGPQQFFPGAGAATVPPCYLQKGSELLSKKKLTSHVPYQMIVSFGDVVLAGL